MLVSVLPKYTLRFGSVGPSEARQCSDPLTLRLLVKTSLFALMPLTVLSDSEVRTVLDNLTREDVLDMHKALADALHSYSTSTEPAQSGCSSSNQPHRLQIKLTSGATTLFMPSIADNGLGIKVVTLKEGSDKRGQPKDLPYIDTAPSPRSSSPVSLRSPITPRPSTPQSPSTPRSHSPSIRQAPTVPSSTTLTHRSRTSSSHSTTRSPHHDLPTPSANPSRSSIDTGSSTSPTGTLTLLSAEGQPRAILSASTITAFRTALASTLLLKGRRHAHAITVFGAGRQAQWHIRLALLLRGSEIHHLHLINRSFERAVKLFKALGEHRNPYIQSIWLEGKLRPNILTPDYGEYTRLAKDAVRSSDVIFCCTPSITPLFPHTWLTSSEGRRKGRYIVAVGSYKSHMAELPVEILQQAVRGPDHSHAGGLIHHRAAGEGGAVVVDTIEGSMAEAGEIINSGIGGQGIVELGELVMLKKAHWAEKVEREDQERQKREREGLRKESGGGHGISHLFKRGHGRSDSGDKRGRVANADAGRKSSRSRSRPPRDGQDVEVSDGGLQEWLQRGNVIYKSVGIGLMDVVVGMEIVRLAEERGIGSTFEDFN